jgi:hypothetical protein
MCNRVTILIIEFNVIASGLFYIAKVPRDVFTGRLGLISGSGESRLEGAATHRHPRGRTLFPFGYNDPLYLLRHNAM